MLPRRVRSINNPTIHNIFRFLFPGIHASIYYFPQFFLCNYGCKIRKATLEPAGTEEMEEVVCEKTFYYELLRDKHDLWFIPGINCGDSDVCIASVCWFVLTIALHFVTEFVSNLSTEVRQPISIKVHSLTLIFSNISQHSPPKCKGSIENELQYNSAKQQII